jgi:MFS family permease
MQRFSGAWQRYAAATFSSLRQRNYRLYYIGQIISTSGTFMQSIAQDWLVLKLSNSGTALGVVTALQYLPILLLAPYGGLVADRFSKRKIILMTQATAGLLALTMGGLVAAGWVRLWMVYVLALGLGLVTAFDMPARQTFVVELVGEADLKNAVTLYSTLVNLSRVIGPMVAGLIIAALGLALCFVLNGLSYVAVILMLLRINPAELRLAPSAARAGGQLRAGLRYMLGNPVLRSTLLMMAIIGMLTFEFQVSLPLLARFAFQGDAGSYALLTASFGAGAVVGGLLIAGQRQVSPGRLARSALLFGLAVSFAAFMPSLWLSAAALVGVGIFSIAFTSLGNSVLQLESTPQMRGRVMAFWTIAMLGSSTLGGPIVGWVGEHVGPRWGLALGGLAALAAAGLGRHLRGRPVSATFAALAPSANPADVATTSELDEDARAVTVGH